MIVRKWSLVNFFARQNYKDRAWCDVVAMDAHHLLLGKSWQYDRRVTHDGCLNTYNFLFNSTKIVLLPKKDHVELKSIKESSSLLTMAKFKDELQYSQMAYALVGTLKSINENVSHQIQPLLEEFSYMFSEDLLEGLPLLRDIQHQISFQEQHYLIRLTNV